MPLPAVGARLPDCPRAWYAACLSRDLGRGQVIPLDLAGCPVVIFRGREDGAARALDAHCAHMGSSLGQGDVMGNSLRCPLHHWEWDGEGRCRRTALAPDGVPRIKQGSYAVAESDGVVFVFNGAQPLYPPPAWGAGAESERLVSCPGPPVHLRCAWHAIAANGFDIEHLRSVHGRGLHEKPVVERLDPYRLRLRYVSFVTGRSLEDRAVKWLSRDRIHLTVTCHGGTVVTVESDLGSLRTKMMLCLRPRRDGTDVLPIFAVPARSFPGTAWLGARAARWLYSAYMRRDLSFMQDMRFHPPFSGNPDEVLEEFLEFLRLLPSDAGMEDSGPSGTDGPASPAVSASRNRGAP